MLLSVVVMFATPLGPVVVTHVTALVTIVASASLVLTLSTVVVVLV